MHRLRPLLTLLAGLGAAAACGCARIDRVLVLDSDPSGAHLYVDGAYVGPTPQRIPYVHPGRVTVRLEKEGYASVAAEVNVKTTTDAFIGPDFFHENLTPGGLHTVASHRFPLTPLSAVSYTDAQLQELLRRASDFRKVAQTPPDGAPGSAALAAPTGTPVSTPAPALGSAATPPPAAVGGLPPPVHLSGPRPPPPPTSPQGPPFPSR